MWQGGGGRGWSVGLLLVTVGHNPQPTFLEAGRQGPPVAGQLVSGWDSPVSLSSASLSGTYISLIGIALVGKGWVA